MSAVPAAAQVPDPFARDLARQLTEAQLSLDDMGFAKAAGPFAGGLPSGGVARFEVMLRAGQQYRIVSVCDARCSGVDLSLYDSASTLVSRVAGRAGAPVMDVSPHMTGAHVIEVNMGRCIDAPCYFAFTIFSR